MIVKDMILAIKKQYLDKIRAGEKLYELRRRFPANFSGRIFVYESKATQCVVGEIRFESIHHMQIDNLWDIVNGYSGVSEKEFFNYFEGLEKGFAVGITEFIEWENPIKINNPPQNYKYFTISRLDIQDKLTHNALF